jgi:predicted lipoprotein with Yx(FWY)xxD motif
MRKRLDRRLAPLLVVVVAGALAASATGAGAARPTVRVVQAPGYGKLLATSGGLTLYHYTDETRGKIDCKGGCAALWPPLLVKKGAKPSAGTGLTARKLGTIRRPDGGVQVTYNGLALYRYAPDRKAGDVKGQGLEHEWYAIAPSGRIITRKAASEEPAAPPPASTTPPDTTPPGGGYGYP